jgi:hypothetical protein
MEIKRVGSQPSAKGPYFSNHDIEGNITAVAGTPALRFRDRARLPCLATLALTCDAYSILSNKRRGRMAPCPMSRAQLDPICPRVF